MYRLLMVISVVALFVAGEAVAADEAQKGQTAKKKASVLEKKAAGEGSKTGPPPSSVVIKKAEAQAVDPAGEAAMNDAITCLARSIYWEARGDGTAAMEATANVVMNRLGHKGFPDTVCGVVKQGSEKGNCQFSWWCDRRADGAKDDESYAVAKEISRKALNKQLPDRTRGALYFHHGKVKPGWSKKYIKTVKVGKMVFYKPHDGNAK